MITSTSIPVDAWTRHRQVLEGTRAQLRADTENALAPIALEIVGLAVANPADKLRRMADDALREVSQLRQPLYHLQQAANSCKQAGMAEVPDQIATEIANHEPIVKHAEWMHRLAEAAYRVSELPLPLCRNCRGTRWIRLNNGIEREPVLCADCEDGSADSKTIVLMLGQWVAVGGLAPC